MAYATVDEYVTRTGGTPLLAAEAAKVGALLDDASALVDGKMPAGYHPPAGIARAVVIAMVIRRGNNPGGFRSRTIGEYSETLNADGGLYLTRDELDDLLSAYEQGGAYTVELDREFMGGG
ncbi:hypothetical protein [Catellatospora sp. NPDC049609]|uniref:hypothetical protein n=1 Tax=Catellatospora sp. NPDC049609 TaxID=3155505 RepID=UPI00342B6D30